MRNANRFGLGEPILGGMGKMSEEARTTLIQADPGKALMTSALYGVSEAIEEESKELTKALLKGPSDAAKKANKFFWDAAVDLFDENVCENQQASFGRLLNNQMDKVIGLCEYFGPEAERAHFRLGEALIHATDRGEKSGWVYAGYVKERKVPDGIKNYKGNSDRIRRGFKDRWYNFPDKKKGEVGPCGLRNIIRDTTAICSTLVTVVENEPDVNNRRLMLFAFLKKNIPAAGVYDEKTNTGKGWCEGIEFLCRDMLKAPRLKEYMTKGQAALLAKTADSSPAPAKPSPKKTDPAVAKAKLEATKAALLKAKAEADAKKLQAKAEADAKKTQSTQKNQGSGGKGGLVALLAAAGGAYFLLKG